MRHLVFFAMLVAFPVQADLYRWVDPQSGSVKFSSYPPPWFGDPQRERGAPAVEVIPYRGLGAPAKPVAAPEKPSPAASMLATLEARWAGLMQFFATLPATTDFNRAGAGVQQQLEAYQALSAELDRLDPAGAQRRRAQEAGVFETMRRGLEAQLSSKPAPQ